MIVSCQGFYQELVSSLEKIPAIAKKENFGSDAQWTIKIKELLVDLAHRQKPSLEVGCSSVNAADNKEWLFDVYWWDRENSDLTLAAEIEWRTDEGSLHYDFQKLIVARASCRLFIFQQKKCTEEVFDNMIALVESFPKSARGDCYVFACYDFTMEKFFFKLHQVK